MSWLLKLRRCCVHLAVREAHREPLAPRHTKLVFCDQSIDITYVRTWEGWLSTSRSCLTPTPGGSSAGPWPPI